MTFCPVIMYSISMKLDYTLKTLEERKALVEKILEEDPHPNQKYLEILSDYLIFCMTDEEKDKKEILTTNRLSTVNKRETSYEGLVDQFENGEDGVYNLINNDKYIIFRPKNRITEQDLEEIPELREQQKTIAFWEEAVKKCEGRDKFIAKSALIEARREQYTIRSFKKPITGMSNKANMAKFPYHISLDENITFDEDGYCVPHGVSLIDPAVCCAIMCNYTTLTQATQGAMDTDLYYLLEEFKDVSKRALADYPVYQLIMKDKIAEMQNIDIQQDLMSTFGVCHSLEYISSLWRKKIPAIIASKAEDDYLE